MGNDAENHRPRHGPQANWTTEGNGMGRLEGKVAIVTGAATGLGQATALLYAKEGAKVVVADLRPEKAELTVSQIHAAGGAAIFVATDVSSEGAVRNLVHATEQHFGALHIMTANAGILGRGASKRLEELTREEGDEIMAVNFWGVFYCLQQAIPAIRRAGGGAISVTTSVAGHYGDPRMPVYSASKHGVIGLVQSLAADLVPHIRVNAVSAGRVRTEIGRHTAEAKGADFPDNSETPDLSDYFSADPLQVAHAHLFLVSDDASFVNGQALVVDGGRTVVPAAPPWWGNPHRPKSTP